METINQGKKQSSMDNAYKFIFAAGIALAMAFCWGLGSYFKDQEYKASQAEHDSITYQTAIKDIENYDNGKNSN